MSLIRNMNSLDLIRIIGIDDINEGKIYHSEKLLELFPYSITNKIPLFYLEKIIPQCKEHDRLIKAYLHLRKRQQQQLFLLQKIACIFSRYDVDYTVFKTLKPFPSIGSDVDLLFLSQDGFKKGYSLLSKNGYHLIGPKFRNLTLHDPQTDINIDLYNEITVSNIIYIDKTKIRDFTTEVNINNIQVPIPTKEVDLLLSIAHSFYKEQLYTLADFYLITIFLTKFTQKQKNHFLQLVNEQHIEYACSLLFRMTQNLHLYIFRNKLEQIEEILSNLYLNSFLDVEIHKTINNFSKKMKLPYKLTYKTAIIGLVDKIINDANTKKSVPHQIKEMMNPLFLQEFISQLVIHVIRETY